MSGELKFNTSQANEAANRISKAGTAMNQEISQLSAEIKKASGWWEGDVADAYEAQYTKVKPALEDMCKLVQDISKQLKSISDAKASFEQKSAAMFK